MRIKPDDNWRWYYDEEHDRMMLDLANGMLFRFPAPGHADAGRFFAHRDSALMTPRLYFSFEEKCRDLELSKE